MAGEVVALAAAAVRFELVQKRVANIDTSACAGMKGWVLHSVWGENVERNFVNVRTFSVGVNDAKTPRCVAGVIMHPCVLTKRYVSPPERYQFAILTSLILR